MVFSKLSLDEQELYLDVLREGITPFDRFVSRGKLEDTVDIPGPRRKIDRYLFRLIKQTKLDSSTRLLPILGSAGTGKTHAYWAYSSIEKKLQSLELGDEEILEKYPKDWSIIYVPSPPAAVRILLHVYTCILDENQELLHIVSNKLVDKWGGYKKKKLGLFGGQDLDETIQNGIREYPGIFADCVKALCIFSLDNERKNLAERWLLGEDLAESELDILGINTVIESDDVCLAMIKIISENAGKTIVLYFDELESPYRMLGPEAEQKFLETLKQIYNNVKNLVMVLAVLKEIWPRILETTDQAMKSRMEQDRELKKFNFDDLKLYFSKAMAFFWEKNNLNPPIYPLFPLNEDILRVIFDKTDGNQRSIIKLIRMYVDKIVFDDMTLTEVIEDEKISKKSIKQKPIKKETKKEKEPSEKEKSILEKIDEMMLDEDYTIEANPASVAGAALKSIKVMAENYNKEIEIKMDFKFKVGKRSYSLAGLIIYENKKYGLELPSIKTFNKSGGVAAFYACKRLTQAISTNSVDKAILIVPEKTGGAKYSSLLKQHKDLIYKFEFNEESAKFLIQQAIHSPSMDGKNMAEVIFGAIPDYIPPTAPWEKPKEIEGSVGSEGLEESDESVESEETKETGEVEETKETKESDK